MNEKELERKREKGEKLIKEGNQLIKDVDKLFEINSKYIEPVLFLGVISMFVNIFVQSLIFIAIATPIFLFALGFAFANLYKINNKLNEVERINSRLDKLINK